MRAEKAGSNFEQIFDGEDLSTFAAGRLELPNGTIVIDVTERSELREARGRLTELAIQLGREDEATRALLVLAKSRISTTRAAQELEDVRSVLRPELAGRLFLATLNGEEIGGEYPKEAFDWIQRLAQGCMRTSTIKTSGRVSQKQIQSILAERHLAGLGPITMGRLAEATGASRPTTIAAIADLEQRGLLYRTDGGVVLHGLTQEIIQRFAIDHSRTRKTVRYADPSGMARSPAEMVNRLAKLQAEALDHIAISGVYGARILRPNLDILGSPRLDLCVFNGDIRFLKAMDAGLQPTTDPGRISLAVHFTKDIRPAAEAGRSRLAPASILDCLADLVQLNLQAQALDFASRSAAAARVRQ